MCRTTTIAEPEVVEAEFAPDRRYRYRLAWAWGEGPRANVVMLNPSTADETTLDPTARRVLALARHWGVAAVEVTNLFALRSARPLELRRVADPVGPDNDAAITRAALAADLVVLAWGTGGTWRGRDRVVRRLLAALGCRPHHLRLTRDGHPAHPLYLPGGLVPRAELAPGTSA